MTNPLQDLADTAAEVGRELDIYTPKGEAPVVVAPDLEHFQEVRNSTDKALADDFLRRYRHLFCNGDGQLYVYQQKRGSWAREDVKSQLFALCSHLSDRLYGERADINEQIAQARAQGREDAVGELTQRLQGVTNLIVHCEKGGTIGTVSRIVEAKLRAILLHEKRVMNPNGDLLACANGVVDMRTKELRWARPEDYITRNTGVRYHPNCDFSWWSQVIEQVFGGNKRLAEFFQVWIGYCATGYTREQAMAVMWGKGSNGKNLLIDAVAEALGGYASALPQGFLDNTGKDTVSMDNNLLYASAQLDGVRLAYLSETNEGGRLRESWVKSSTGDRKMRARLAHQDYYEFKATHKFTVSTNHKPEIRGTDDGVWRRIRLLPFTQRFGSPEEVAQGVANVVGDNTLLDRVTGDYTGREAVLAWIVDGAYKYLNNGLQRYTPPEVEAETRAYRREQDVLGQFLQTVSEYVPPAEWRRVQELEGGGSNAKAFARLSMEERLRVDKRELWQMHVLWCEENGHYARSATKFARDIVSAQRFWVDDVGTEMLMPPLEAVRNREAQFYRYIALSEHGRRLLGQARYRAQQGREPSSRQDADERF